MVHMQAPEPLQNASQIPMKVDSALEPPAGLEHFRLQQPGVTPEEYSVGEEILALRSNGSWSPGTITKIEDDKVTVVLKEGVKHIRKEKMHALLKKQDLAQPLKEALIANKNAALQVENARLVQENIMMGKQARLQAENARLAQENMMMRMQSQIMAPMLDGTIPNSWSKIGAKKALDISWGTVSTATGGSSLRQSFPAMMSQRRKTLWRTPFLTSSRQ